MNEQGMLFCYFGSTFCFVNFDTTMVHVKQLKLCFKFYNIFMQKIYIHEYSK